MNPPNSHRVILQTLLFLTGISLTSYWISSSIYTMFMKRRYTQRRIKKQNETIQAKKTFFEYLQKNHLPNEEIEQIVNKSFLELISCLKHGEFSPQKVLLAYQHKAFEVDQRCNCIVEFLYPNFDEINLNGPLAGVPVSIKESLPIKGSESHAGMVCFLNGPSDKTSVIIQIIKSIGGVPFVRTNVPQSLFSVLSSNPINGVTLNPLALDRSPGGSSSGEAALIAGGGSCLGFGTDLGGSVRLPAAMCGIVGFKPTPNRVSKIGVSSHGRYITVDSSVGFLGRDVETCLLVAQSIWNSNLHHELDYFCPPLKFNQVSQSKPLRIGYFISDGSFTPVPAVQRAVLHIKNKLESLGHELLPWNIPYTGKEWLCLFLTCVTADGGLPLANNLRYDMIETNLKRFTRIVHTSWLGRLLLSAYYNTTGCSENNYMLKACSTIYDIPTLMKHLDELKDFQQTIYSSWYTAKLDAVICPAFGMAAPVPVCTTRSFTGMLSYLNLFNLVGMPAGCLPSGIQVNEGDLKPLEISESNKTDPSISVYPINTNWHRTARDVSY
ncbi:Vitamin D3 hydroxylase-associated protein [Schistosoma japonicum]|uniref:Vitamin D3 hydroxylase-associated protein n=1 Tax=Schistosoma japonicum TaxID=6182 RepID=A0A4Z2D3R6_SCHJA|nr:Vitamin D3 hydroxylase-associated protein [Schistosoma japonicum]